MFRNSLLGTFLLAIFSSSIAFAACVDLSKGNNFTLTRTNPFFEVTNRVMNDGTLEEKRVSKVDGSTLRVTLTYWQGVIPVDRKTARSRARLKMSEEAKSLDLSARGRTYKIPTVILIDGKEVDRGFFEIRPIRKRNLVIDSCTYPVMVVRTSIVRNKGEVINEEALLSLEAGMLLGNVAMTADWKPKHGVFFDKIRAN
ncbi:hypothetical protein LR948_05060 [Roseivivax sp. GX 12232]|uniref:hypothetical protein n=1 Tax=Roseivivax sp. GX 12232 TaxID=2900547 RepID=UPI001E527555|nr:hypothetical protein [Roseivivax sp. GX 12232]MCE0504710.1 hypothetical protein [Roseivivax sp. GX 12232]